MPKGRFKFRVKKERPAYLTFSMGLEILLQEHLLAMTLKR
jgi:hypothetical protein